MKTAVRLRSLRDLDRSIPELLDLVAETPPAGGEFAGIDDDPDAFAALVPALDGSGSNSTSAG